MEWFKILLEKARVHSVVAAFIPLGICAILCSNNFWILLIVYSISFLLIELGFYWHKLYMQKRIESQRIKKLAQREEEEFQYHKDMIWHFFLAISESDLNLAIKLFKIENRDPSDRYVRVIKRKYVEYFQSFYLSNFELRTGDHSYIPCIRIETLGNTTVLHFWPYFYDLLEFYIKTGKKEKLK